MAIRAVSDPEKKAEHPNRAINKIPITKRFASVMIDDSNSGYRPNMISETFSLEPAEKNQSPDNEEDDDNPLIYTQDLWKGNLSKISPS